MPADDATMPSGDDAAPEAEADLPEYEISLADLEAQAEADSGVRWQHHTERIVAYTGALSMLLTALGFPTAGLTMAEFSSFNPDNCDPAIAKRLRITAKALLLDLVASSRWEPEPVAEDAGEDE